MYNLEILNKMNSLDYKNWHKENYDTCVACMQHGEQHHLKPIGMGRDRKKPLPEHYTVVMLCREHHSQIHNIGIKSFQELFQVNLWEDVANQLINYLEE